MELIRKKEFTIVALDLKDEIFMVLVGFLTIFNEIHLSRRAQKALLKFDGATTTFSPKYSEFTNILSLELTTRLPEYTRINNHTIDLVNSKQPLYELIYNPRLVELDTLKTYIKTNLANDFIKSSKSPTSALILFVQKLAGSFCLYVGYQSLNNLSIKN